MPRLVSSRTGVVVNVSDETAAAMTADWTAAPESDEKPAKRGRSSKTD